MDLFLTAYQLILGYLKWNCISDCRLLTVPSVPQLLSIHDRLDTLTTESNRNHCFQHHLIVGPISGLAAVVKHFLSKQRIKQFLDINIVNF